MARTKIGTTLFHILKTKKMKKLSGTTEDVTSVIKKSYSGVITQLETTFLTIRIYASSVRKSTFVVEEGISMGSVKRDIYRNARQHDSDYAYSSVGVEMLLKDVFRIQEAGGYKGDIDAVTILCDLKLALDSGCLTPKMRQVVALYYFAQLTEAQISNILDITQQAVNDALTCAAERIAKEMELGGSNRGGRGAFEYSKPGLLYDWINRIGAFQSTVHTLPKGVTLAILEKLSHEGDPLALETLRQREGGLPLFVPDYSEVDEYPCLTEDQFKWRDRRMSFVPDVHYDNKRLVGRKKTAFLNDNDEWTYGKQKIFSA